MPLANVVKRKGMYRIMVKNINRAEYESFSEKIVKHLSWYENRFLYTLVKQIESFIFNKEEELKNFFQEVLTPNGYNLMVTNKDIDLEVEDLSKIVAWGINKALHQNILLM